MKIASPWIQHDYYEIVRRIDLNRFRIAEILLCEGKFEIFSAYENLTEIRFTLIENAQSVVDDFLLREGWRLCNQEEWQKFQILHTKSLTRQ